MAELGYLFAKVSVLLVVVCYTASGASSTGAGPCIVRRTTLPRLDPVKVSYKTVEPLYNEVLTDWQKKFVGYNKVSLDRGSFSYILQLLGKIDRSLTKDFVIWRFVISRFHCFLNKISNVIISWSGIFIFY